MDQNGMVWNPTVGMVRAGPVGMEAFTFVSNKDTSTNTD